jgi:hypothetical protein
MSREADEVIPTSRMRIETLIRPCQMSEASMAIADESAYRRSHRLCVVGHTDAFSCPLFRLARHPDVEVDLVSFRCRPLE